MASTPFSSDQRRLFIFLGVATFFEGFDFFALAQVLPNLRADLGLSKQAAGWLFAFVNLGTVIAWPLIRRADRWGRRRVMMITIVGYTVFTLLSGLAWDVWSFGLFQFAARIFLIGEWATSMVYAAEEYPADRRGTVIGVLQAFSSLGAVVCAGVAPLLLSTAYGWRSVYFAGILPLMVLAYARRGLRETRRFAAQAAAPAVRREPILRSPHRRRVLQLGVVWFFTYACSNTAISFWKDFAVNERGLTDGQVGLAMTIGALGSMPLVFLSGRLLDAWGRRRGAVLIYAATSAGVALAYTLHDRWALTAALVVAIFGVSAVLPVVNAYTTELFPTARRAEAFAWANNLLGRPGYVAAPILIGGLAETHGWGPAIAPTAVLPIVALLLILRWFPETRGLELEDTAENAEVDPAPRGS